LLSLNGEEVEYQERKGGVAALCCLFALCCLLFAGRAAARQASQLPLLSEQAQEALKTGRFKDAQRIYEQILKQDPLSPQAYSNLALALYMQGQYPAAISVIQKALHLDPHLTNGRVLLALAYFNLNKLREAIPLFEKLYAEKSDDPTVVQHLGLAYLKVADDEKALAVLSHWVELEPTNLDALYYKGKAASYVSLNAFEKLKELAPDSPRMHELQGELFAQEGQTGAAISEYRKALSVRPGMAGLHYALGRLYWENSRLKEARTELEQELQISPHDAATHYLLGDVLLLQNDLPDAAEHLSRALDLQPGLVEARLDMAKLYHLEGKTPEAIATLQVVIREDPKRPDAHYLLYQLYKDAKELEKARAELETFQTLKHLATEKAQKSKELNLHH
jgi:protein O-GlcNAc transferase